MSIGFPDGQRITQWLGSPLVAATGFAVGNVLHTDGPFSLASWASVVVAVKPAGGNVTVTVRQQIRGGPASLEQRGQFVVPDGQVFFESVVLFGDAVYLDLQGANPGVTVDYALYPSNTTTNAQVLAAATVNLQHNEVLLAAEPTLDFVDAGIVQWVLTDDPANTRMKITPPIPGAMRLADSLLGIAASAIDVQNIDQTFKHLLILLHARGDAAIVNEYVGLRFDNDALGNYDDQSLNAAGAAVAAAEGIAATNGRCAAIPAGGGAANWFGGGAILIPNYAVGAAAKHWIGLSNSRYNVTAGTGPIFLIGGTYRGSTVVNRVTLIPQSGGNFAAGSRATVYGLS